MISSEWISFGWGVALTLSAVWLLQHPTSRSSQFTPPTNYPLRWLCPHILGQEIRRVFLRGTSAAAPENPPTLETEGEDVMDSSSDDDDALPCKMVFVIRTDLEMTKGKVAAQCAHAVLAVYRKAMSIRDPTLPARHWLSEWKKGGQAKITLKCVGEEEMLELEARALSLGLAARSIVDAGRTQIAAGSRTVLAIGPGPVDLINQITGHLKLY